MLTGSKAPKNRKCGLWVLSAYKFLEPLSSFASTRIYNIVPEYGSRRTRRTYGARWVEEQAEAAALCAHLGLRFREPLGHTTSNLIYLTFYLNEMRT
jgi:hypothetical protein